MPPKQSTKRVKYGLITINVYVRSNDWVPVDDSMEVDFDNLGSAMVDGDTDFPDNHTFITSRELTAQEAVEHWPVYTPPQDFDRLAFAAASDAAITTADSLESGRMYRVDWKVDNDRRGRTHSDILRYIQQDGTYLYFDARPVAGTESIPLKWIVSLVQMPQSTPISVGKRLKPVTGADAGTRTRR